MPLSSFGEADDVHMAHGEVEIVDHILGGSFILMHINSNVKYLRKGEVTDGWNS
jgi:hypothetical protein